MNESDELNETDKLLQSRGIDDSLLEDFVDKDNHKPKIIAIEKGSRPGSIVCGKVFFFD